MSKPSRGSTRKPGESKRTGLSLSSPTAATASFPVVGVGASAGGLAAVSELLKNIPPAAGATLIIVQHLDPKHGSLAPEILSRVSRIPVDEVKDGMRIEPNHVYVIPPNSNLRLSHGVLKLSPRTETRGQHLPIDTLFRSLAEDRKEQAIGVVLSGIASDGTMGVQAIKAEGGFTLAQDPVSAQYDGMPRSAILSGAVDIVETPEGIAREIVMMSLLLSKNSDGPKLIEPKPPPGATNGNLSRIFALVRNATGVDFTHYKRSTIQRRIARRLFLLKIDGVHGYVAYLETHSEEVKALFADILIHVTGFFRDPEAYEALKTRILPKCLEAWDPAVPFRIWIPGCSSGEEAYSIAMLFFECLDKAKVRPALQIFASDISEPSLQKGRAAIYPGSIVKEVSKARLNRFFEKTEGGYRIAKWIRDTCLFSRHDLTADPPFARIDLISCRNVLIYFTSELQKRVVPILHYALKPGGILWLGRSESLSGFGSLFTTGDRTNKFFFKRTIASPVKIQFPVSRLLPEVVAGRKSSSSGSTLQEVQVEADRVALQQYVPPSVVINDAAEIVQVRGRLSPYLELTTGQASLNLFKLAPTEILSDLRYVINSARNKGAAARKNGLTLRTRGERHHFGITVVPLRSSPASRERYFSVFFEETPGVTKRLAAGGRGKPSKSNRKWTALEQQQAVDERSYQQDLIEEYETTQEELISSNEELQSTNEELQSTNEELETAKEELQSANEEMTTINEELQTRNAETLQLTNDLTNLLASVDIPIVMVGPDAKIRRFTPKAGQVLNLIPGDVGRPIGDIKPDIQGPNFDQIVAEVIESLVLKELETQDSHGNWHRLQVRPYRTADNRIDGAVIALTDITILKQAADALQIAHDNALKIIETMPTPILVLRSDGRLQTANNAFYTMFKVSPAEAEGRFFSELCDGSWNLPPLLKMLEAVLTEGIAFHDFEIESDFPQVGHKCLVLHATATRFAGAAANTALVAIEDVTVRRATADKLRHTEERYRHLLERAHDGILIINETGLIEFANGRIETMFGYSEGELNGQPYQRLIPGQYLETHNQHHAAFMRQPEARDMGRGEDLYGKAKDGTVFPVEISLSPVKVDSKTVVTAIVRDISERKKIEVERRDLLSRETNARLEAERANQMKDDFLSTLSHELRTPLATILSWAQMLRLGNADKEKMMRAVSRIETSAQDQGQIIDDLLDISRIQAGKLRLELRDIEPAEYLDPALDSVRGLAESKSIQVRTEFDPAAGRVSGDSGRLQQVFRNLFTNAIKFTPAGGTITVRSKHREDPNRLEIRVEDTGKGISPEFLPRLFLRFTQEDSTPRRTYGGLGLGLSIVRHFVEMHGGEVTAESPGEGKGTVFTVILPSSMPAAASDVGTTTRVLQKTPSKADKPAGLRGLRVLVVDDREDAREAFSTILKSFGAEVRTAATALAGLAALRQSKPDVLLCDIAMPEMDGLSLIRKIRELKPNAGGKVPAIALTAFAGAENVRQALEAGFDAHLAKPVDAVNLSHLVAQLAGRLK